jgi:membrane-bound lytic murein transglycosylase D
MRIATRCVLLLTFLVGSALAQTPTGTDTGSYDRSELFPRPPQLRDAIEFWTRVYTEVDSNGGFIHDSRYLGVVYETIRLDEGTSSRQRRRVTQRAQREYRDILNKLAADDGGSLTTDEARVRALWPADATAEDFRQAAQRLRFQLGQADRYKAGLMRSGRWKPHILAVLEARGLPSELAVLPHVESSFDPTAYSKVGAAGMWQFTRSTGLRYMQIDHIIDERRDPYLSTDAAARLLEDNYAVIQSWPLALTAYNHGLAGMRRAVGRLGTDDIGVIVDDYRSRTFGFASRNFYAAFIAALEVDQNADRYFRDIAIDRPEDLVVIEMPAYIDATPLAAALNISMRELRRLNPALMDSVWAGDKYVPAGFPLRLPRTVVADASELEALVPASERFAEQRPDLYHRVRPGDTLSGIADQYRVSLAALVRANGLSNRNFIRVGQQITLPIAGGQAAPPLPSASPATPPADGQYVVRRGDSIDLIARRFGVDQGELLSLNSIANRNRIYPGQVLELPGMAGESAAPTESPATSVSNVAVAAAEVVDTIIETVVETVVAEEAPEVVASAIDTEAPALAETVTEALSNELAFSDDAEPDLDSRCRPERLFRCRRLDDRSAGHGNAWPLRRLAGNSHAAAARHQRHAVSRAGCLRSTHQTRFLDGRCGDFRGAAPSLSDRAPGVVLPELPHHRDGQSCRQAR